MGGVKLGELQGSKAPLPFAIQAGRKKLMNRHPRTNGEAGLLVAGDRVRILVNGGGDVDGEGHRHEQGGRDRDHR